MAWPPITQADIELKHKPQEVRGASCDDGSGVAGPRLAAAIAAACRRGQLILGRAWPTQAQIELLVANDEAVKGALVDMAFYELVKGIKSWIGPDGKCLFAGPNKDAEALLNGVADAELRSNGEATAGVNPRYADRVNLPKGTTARSSSSRPA
jgi:hypothetical protein